MMELGLSVKEAYFKEYSGFILSRHYGRNVICLLTKKKTNTVVWFNNNNGKIRFSDSERGVEEKGIQDLM